MITLADGARFNGTLHGGAAAGEVVFNTAMLGFEETLTDPSYAGQVLVFAAAHVGNTPVTRTEQEAEKIYAKAVVLNHEPNATLVRWLEEQNVPLVYGVDTRALISHLRTHGSQEGVIGDARADFDTWKTIREISVKAPVKCGGPGRFSVVAYDFGSKRSMISLLQDAGADVTLVPPDFPANDALQLGADGIFLSNGPGDPAAVPIAEIQALLGRIPLFGICLGHQLLARAIGAPTFKLPFGHRGVNHPVLEHETGRVFVTVQNHGYAVGELPAGVEVTHTHVNDGSIEGISIPELRAFSVQFHPEAAPGPHDTRSLFWRFGSSL